MISTENPATERSEIMSEELRGNPSRGSAETENTNKNEDDEELRSELLQDVPEWLQEFRENLVHESTSEERRRNSMQKSADTSSSSHDPLMEPRAHVEPSSSKHKCIYTHFPKDRNCNICLEVKIFPGIIVRLHHTDQKQIVRLHHTDQKQMGMLKEQCAEQKKAPLSYCCNQVWMKIGGQILWSVTPICETSQICYLMGRHHMKGGSECPSTNL